MVITWSCAARSVPLVSSAKRRAMSGAKTIAIAVRIVSTVIATVNNADVDVIVSVLEILARTAARAWPTERRRG